MSSTRSSTAIISALNPEPVKAYQILLLGSMRYSLIKKIIVNPNVLKEPDTLDVYVFHNALFKNYGNELHVRAYVGDEESNQAKLSITFTTDVLPKHTQKLNAIIFCPASVEELETKLKDCSYGKSLAWAQKFVFCEGKLKTDNKLRAYNLLPEVKDRKSFFQALVAKNLELLSLEAESCEDIQTFGLGRNPEEMDEMANNAPEKSKDEARLLRPEFSKTFKL